MDIDSKVQHWYQPPLEVSRQWLDRLSPEERKSMWQPNFMYSVDSHPYLCSGDALFDTWYNF